MKRLKITVRHGDVLTTPCSAVFLKHIEGRLSTPELRLNDLLRGGLPALYGEGEKQDHVLLELDGTIAGARAYVVNFHEQDLPFSYHSVDLYARTMIRVAADGGFGPGKPATCVATAVHGPGAGLDASEAMETLIAAFADEVRTGRPLGALEEVVLVEADRAVFERLQERLKYLVKNGVVLLDRGSYYVTQEAARPLMAKDDAARVERLELKHLFIAMPYAKAFNNVYYFGIKLTVEQRGRKCERVDQDAFTGDIVDRVKNRIASSELVIADITTNNPNVLFEVGYAEGVGRPVILISQEQEIPFDLKTWKRIPYDPQDIQALADALGAQLDAIIGS